MIRSLPHRLPRIEVLLLCMGLIVLAPACDRGDQAVRADLERYLRLVNDWAPVEAETARVIDRILQTQFVDDAEVRRQIDADRPRVVAHIRAVAAVHPATPPLHSIHEGYLRAWRDLLAGYDAIVTGLDTGEASRLSRGRAALDAWRSTIRRTATELRQLQPG